MCVVTSVAPQSNRKAVCLVGYVNGGPWFPGWTDLPSSLPFLSSISPQPQADSFSLISQAAAVIPPSFCLPLLLPPPTTHMGLELCASCSNEINNVTLTGLCSSLYKWNSGADCIDPINAPWCLSAYGGG